MPEELLATPLHLLAPAAALKAAGISPSDSPADRLKKAGIRHFDELIHKQKKEWLVKNFGEEGGKYPVNVARLMRNLVWQTKERIAGGEPPFKDLVRTYWYMYVKPTLARAVALAEETDQYKQLSENLADLVRVYQVMKYKDIGFRDENAPNRKIGPFGNVIPFAEKLGHFDYLAELYAKHRVTVIALGGQPSVLNVEYFVDDIKANRTSLRRSFYLYSIVDFDPSGWIIRDAFLNSLRYYGIKNLQTFDLINPDMLDKDEILQARYPIKAGPDMEEKNRQWLEDVAKRRYANMKYLIDEEGGKTKLYGLEAEAVSTSKIDAELEKIMVPVIGEDEGKLKLYEMKNLNKAVEELIVFKTTHPAPTPG
jgi:hypothetical protein